MNATIACAGVFAIASMLASTVLADAPGSRPCEVVLLGSGADQWSDYGRVVAADGDRVAVAATWDSEFAPLAGSVYVFRSMGPGWIEEAKLMPWDATRAAAGFMGKSIDLEGDVLVAGAPGTDSDVGAALVFRHGEFGWMPEPIRRHGPTLPGDLFGEAVAISGKTLAIAAPGAGGAIPGTGRVFIFRYGDGIWTQTAMIVPPMDATFFGARLDLLGDTLVVGDPLAGDGGTGAVHVFRLLDGGWKWLRSLESPSPIPDGRFGERVALDGDLLAVAAPGEPGPATGRGAVHMFRSALGDWWPEATLRPSHVGGATGFGWSLALRDEMVVVGRPLDGMNGEGAGAAELFASTAPGVWESVRLMLAQDPMHEPPYWFGSEIAMSQRFIVAGAFGATYVDETALPAGCDCNGNGQGDWVDVLAGLSIDVNHDGAPDECQCLGDVNDDGFIDENDVVAVLLVWGGSDPCPEDIDCNGVVGFNDVLCVICSFGPCP